MIHWYNDLEPEPPFIASTFNYYLSDDLDGYVEYDELTLELAKKTEGFLGYESFKSGNRGTFISYWKDIKSIEEWSKNPIHIEAKKQGMARWYAYYHSVISEVKRFHKKRASS